MRYDSKIVESDVKSQRGINKEHVLFCSASDILPIMHIKGKKNTAQTSLFQYSEKQEDLKRSSDLFNKAKKVKVNLGLSLKHILFSHMLGLRPFWSSDLKQSKEYPYEI